MKQLRLLTVLGLFYLSLPGCGSVFPKPHPSKLYVLTALSTVGKTPEVFGQNSGRAVEDSDAPISVGIGPTQLPGYLDRQEIMVRVEPNRFETLEYDRWAEPLEDNFTRVVMQNLGALLRIDQILMYPWPRSKKPCYRVDVQVLRFDLNSVRQAVLVARWKITEINRNERVASNEFRVVRHAKDNSMDAGVTALSEAVADLSQEIAQTLKHRGAGAQC